ncbi:MAG: hypothetical protein WBR56_04950 [Sedimenticolaceae bacterium]
MRWFVLLLLMANLTLFFWTQQQSRQAAALREAALPEIGHLRLMSEVREEDGEPVTFMSDLMSGQPLLPVSPATSLQIEAESERQTAALPEADGAILAVPPEELALQGSDEPPQIQAPKAPEAIDVIVSTQDQSDAADVTLSQDSRQVSTTQLDVAVDVMEAPEPTASTAMQSESPAIVAIAEGSAVAAERPEARCSRIGPLTTDDADALINRLPGYITLVSDVSEEYAQVNGYYVLIPVLASRAAGLKKLQELADAGFEDTWLFRSGALRNAISLGLFRREASARRHAERVQNKGFTTEVKEITSLRERRWLVVRDARESDAPINLPLPEGVTAEKHGCP